ncbi:hypothetical protein CK203_008590 [Vitis vinifera]|uniref:Uncharacterized protein n=1 Tax=Vitis vinifera TaxID=29760 RepID=A0A438KDI7_VITVI|nr:hypothetical protein CK203_008590 [Vitis vinifera]
MMTGKLVWSCEQFEGFDMRDLLRRIAYNPELPTFPSNISEQGRHFLESCLHRDIDEKWPDEDSYQAKRRRKLGQGNMRAWSVLV